MAFLVMGAVTVIAFAGLLAFLRTERDHRLASSATTALVVDDDRIERTMADGRVETIEWDAVVEVEVITTDVGVHREDGAIIVLAADETHGCLVPSRLAAERGVIERLGRLPGFDTRRLVQALDQAPPSRTTCWNRPV